MDPFTIAASVTKITSTCLVTGKKIYDLSCRYQDAPRNMVAISSEVAVVSASLSQIQALILSKQDPETLLRSRPEIAATLDTALTGCMVLFSCLDEEIGNVTRHAHRKHSSAWKGKISMAWKHEVFQELLDGIRGQQLAINTLIQLLQMDSLLEITRLLQRKAPDLQKTVERTQSLRRSHPQIAVAQSIYSQEDRVSLYSIDDSLLASSDLSFDFDDTVVNSVAYRRVFAAAKQRSVAPQLSRVPNDAASLELSAYPAIPAGAVVSPPDSHNSDDDEGKERLREHDIAELQKAVRSIDLRREGSPVTSNEHVQLHAQAVDDSKPVREDSRYLRKGFTYVRALYDYEGDSSRLELSLWEGDYIRVLDKLHNGWWDGIVDGCRGWFPSNYCVEVHAPDEESYRSSQEEQCFWIPQATPDGKLFYFSTLTGDSFKAPKRTHRDANTTEAQEEQRFWIPQATPAGELCYFNALTGDTRAEIPFEAPMTQSLPSIVSPSLSGPDTFPPYTSVPSPPPILRGQQGPLRKRSVNGLTISEPVLLSTTSQAAFATVWRSV